MSHIQYLYAHAPFNALFVIADLSLQLMSHNRDVHVTTNVMSRHLYMVSNLYLFRNKIDHKPIK